MFRVIHVVSRTQHVSAPTATKIMCDMMIKIFVVSIAVEKTVIKQWKLYNTHPNHTTNKESASC